ncbi:hypothetical protein BN2476_490101 [Paraburkholderia piptadeniae]|uniref:Uncharacterized protein n=1 Tax=Paraburkholderia piptadeniae TaxID=1701573 RepID=A0A1N7SF98_9BURK|nr:hypothetical protein BN2476_490101 [Paraburkholderia piptadeniae]
MPSDFVFDSPVFGRAGNDCDHRAIGRKIAPGNIDEYPFPGVVKVLKDHAGQHEIELVRTIEFQPVTMHWSVSTRCDFRWEPGFQGGDC